MAKRMVAAVAVMLGWGASAAAAPVLLFHTYSGNDCAGVFGTEFYGCEVSGSPVIAKYDTGNSGGWTINNSLYSTVTGSEWEGTFLTSNASTGTWTYTPGLGDPGIKYWVAKGGNAFNLFWQVDSSATTPSGPCATTPYNSAACLAQALVVTTGSYSTTEQKGLSHITFYNTGRHITVPAPTSMMLLGLGLVGLAARIRRRP